MYIHHNGITTLLFFSTHLPFFLAGWMCPTHCVGYKMVLIIARREAGLVAGCRSRAVFSQDKAKGNYQAKVHTRSDDPCDSQMEDWTSCLVAKDLEMRIGKQLQAAMGPN
jgi:hypothetical protein